MVWKTKIYNVAREHFHIGSTSQSEWTTHKDIPEGLDQRSIKSSFWFHTVGGWIDCKFFPAVSFLQLVLEECTRPCVQISICYVLGV